MCLPWFENGQKYIRADTFETRNDRQPDVNIVHIAKIPKISDHIEPFT